MKYKDEAIKPISLEDIPISMREFVRIVGRVSSFESVFLVMEKHETVEDTIIDLHRLIAAI